MFPSFIKLFDVLMYLPEEQLSTRSTKVHSDAACLSLATRTGTVECEAVMSVVAVG